MDNIEKYMKQGVDSKALVTTLIMKLPLLLIIAVAGAIIGSGLNLIVATAKEKDAKYVSEYEYYIEFSDGILETMLYYNAYTWNDILGNDNILGRAMDILGSEYYRDQVRADVTASIASDVRYLIVQVKGESPKYVGNVGEAMSQALAEFGQSMNEFVRIYNVRKDEPSLEKIPHFTLRSALLGGFVFFAIAFFIIILRFCIGSSFYTKRDITKCLCVPVYGIEFKDSTYEGAIEMPSKSYNEMFYEDEEGSLIAIVPFGKPFREKLLDEVDSVELKGRKVIGAVLVDADKIWYKIYKNT